jgi:hypothetical protein
MRKPEDGWLSAQLSITNNSEVATGEEETIIRQHGKPQACCRTSLSTKLRVMAQLQLQPKKSIHYDCPYPYLL